MEEQEKVIELTDEQKKFVMDNYLMMDHQSLTKAVFKDDTLDGRSLKGRAIKSFLTGQNLSIAKPEKTTKQEIELTEIQKQFIDTNHSSMKVIEMTRLLFPTNEDGTPKRIAPTSKEFRLVFNYTKKLSENSVDLWDEVVESKEYKPPLNIQAMIGKANEYIINSLDPSKSAYDFNNLKPSEEKNLKILLSFVKTARFRYQASMYDKKADRRLFESTFIRFVADKASELTPEEVDMYIAAAAETINVAQIERQIQNLEKTIEDILSDQSDEEGKRVHLSHNFVELVNSSREKLDKAKLRFKSLIESLSGSRAKRIENRMNQNATVINLFDAWITEDKRKEIIALGMKEKAEDREETKRLEDMDAVVALIAGMTKEEAAN